MGSLNTSIWDCSGLICFATPHKKEEETKTGVFKWSLKEGDSLLTVPPSVCLRKPDLLLRLIYILTNAFCLWSIIEFFLLTLWFHTVLPSDIYSKSLFRALNHLPLSKRPRQVGLIWPQGLAPGPWILPKRSQRATRQYGLFKQHPLSVAAKWIHGLNTFVLWLCNIM